MYSVIGPGGQTYGPVDAETIKQWCAQGRITSDTKIVDPIDGQTKRAVDLPEIAQHIRPPAPPTATRTPSYSNFGSPSFNSSLYNTPNPYPAFSMAPPKSKLVAILLAFFLGVFGIHRFYMGHIGTGIAMLLMTVLTAGVLGVITGIWAIVDIVLIATGGLRDGNNRPLTWP